VPAAVFLEHRCEKLIIFGLFECGMHDKKNIGIGVDFHIYCEECVLLGNPTEFWTIFMTEKKFLFRKIFPLYIGILLPRLLMTVFPPNAPHVLVDLAVFPPRHGRSVTDF